MTEMADPPPSSEKPNRNPKRLSLPWLIALVVGMCVVAVIVEAEALDIGTYLGGNADIGAWLGLTITFLALCVMGGIVARQFANPSLPIICGALVVLAPAQGGGKVGRNLGGHVGAWVGFFLMFAIATGFS
jgi:hypothetical protein